MQLGNIVTNQVPTQVIIGEVARDRGSTADASLRNLAEQYLEMLLAGNRSEASLLMLDALNDGVSIKDLYLKVFQSAQHEIGRRWQANRISVAQEHYCTAATQLIMAQLYGQIMSGERKPLTLLAAAVGDELHELGVRMVADFFEMDGWHTFYAGANVPEDRLIGMLRDHKPALLCLSATMTPHVEQVRRQIEAIRARNDCRGTRILVGGRPFNSVPSLWREVKADGWAKDANEAVEVANRLLNA